MKFLFQYDDIEITKMLSNTDRSLVITIKINETLTS